MDRDERFDRKDAELDKSASAPTDRTVENDKTPNPPRTTTGKMTAPKFGSAASGGFEIEPGPERD